MSGLRFHLAAMRFSTWLNSGNNALNLAGLWGLIMLGGCILAIEILRL